MNKKQAKAERERLLRMLKQFAPDFGVTGVKTVENQRVYLDGGDLCAFYDKETRKITVWGRGSRSSGAGVQIETLQKVELECREWHDTLEVEADA